MNLTLNKKYLEIEKYFIPLAAFFLLISTAALNFFIVSAVVFGVFRIIYENRYVSKISMKFMLYGVLLFFFLCLSTYYTVSDFDNIYLTLKKYIKLLYIPVLFYCIKKIKTKF